MRAIMAIMIALCGLRMMATEPSAERLTAREKMERRPWHSIALTAAPGYVFTSIRDELRPEPPEGEGENTHFAASGGFRYMMTLNDPEVRYYWPGVYQGGGFQVTAFGGVRAPKDELIGMPWTFYVTQGAPVWEIVPGLSVGYEWNFGVSAGWKGYSDSNSHFNLTSGSSVNAYLNLGCMLSYDITEQLSMKWGVDVTHFSNGNTSWPNPGVNMIGLRVTMAYNLGRTTMRSPGVLPDTTSRRKWTVDVTGWYGRRKRVYRGEETPVLLRGHFSCAGVTVAPMREVWRWCRVGAGVDVQWDDSSDLRRNQVEGTTGEGVKFYRPELRRQISAGISAHAEWRMPVFAVNVGIGCNVVAPEENRGTYQNLTLKAYVWRGVYLNVGYQLRDFSKQSNLMLGAGVTI